MWYKVSYLWGGKVFADEVEANNEIHARMTFLDEIELNTSSWECFKKGFEIVEVTPIQ